MPQPERLIERDAADHRVWLLRCLRSCALPCAACRQPLREHRGAAVAEGAQVHHGHDIPSLATRARQGLQHWPDAGSSRMRRCCCDGLPGDVSCYSSECAQADISAVLAYGLLRRWQPAILGTTDVIRDNGYSQWTYQQPYSLGPAAGLLCKHSRSVAVCKSGK
jgi:hypothetical protein